MTIRRRATRGRAVACDMQTSAVCCEGSSYFVVQPNPMVIPHPCIGVGWTHRAQTAKSDNEVGVVGFVTGGQKRVEQTEPLVSG